MLGELTTLTAGPSHFSSLEITKPIIAQARYAKPLHLCTEIENEEEVRGKIAIIQRGDCTFVDKARRAMNAGATAVIIIDNVPETSIANQPPFAMSGDGQDNVIIPTCFLFTIEANTLRDALNFKRDLEVKINILWYFIN